MKQRGTSSHSNVVMITATPYFLSKLHGSRLKGSFNSYLSLTYTGVNFASVAYATATVSTSDSNSRIKTSAAVIAFSNILLALSPILPIEGATFFTFVILNGMVQACAGSFLQSAVVGLTALFGSDALAAMFTGQAVVGVGVSAVQYVSAATTSSLPPPHVTAGEPIDLSIFAFIFFSLAGGCMVLSAVIHAHLRRLPFYHTVVDPFERQKGMIVEEEVGDGDVRENEPFLARSVELQVPASISVKRMARKNALYNFTVAWVFIVTLASIGVRAFLGNIHSHLCRRRCFQQSRVRLHLFIWDHCPHFIPQFYSCHFTSLFSTSVTGSGGICVHSLDVSYGRPSAWPPFLWRVRSSSLYSSLATFRSLAIHCRDRKVCESRLSTQTSYTSSSSSRLVCQTGMLRPWA